jgi:glycerol-3-phosphate dehydrogenase
MGPCQGGFCTYRAVALWEEIRGQRIGSGLTGTVHTGATLYAEQGADGSDPPKDEPASAGVALLRHFLQERWKGLTAIAWGDQLRQARLDEIIYLDTLGVDLLPDQPSGDGLVTSHPAIATEYHTA